MNKMNILKDNGNYYFFNQLTIEKKLEVKNYTFDYDSFGKCFLKDCEDFKFPDKVYDIDKDLKSLIKLNFESNKDNLGVLLTGNKGQGKSVLAKTLCKEMNLPVIMINKSIESDVAFISFFNNIKQDYVLLIDEFEKLFDLTSNTTTGDKKQYHSQEAFLSFMDGMINNNDNKILFLLTTNNKVNDFLLNRPSRIKFLKEYDELPEELFDLITDDKLINKEFKEDLKNNTTFTNLNIDLLTSIISDINLYNKPFSSFMNYYNYRLEEYVYEFNEVNGATEKFVKYWKTKVKITSKTTYINGYEVHNWKSLDKDKMVFTSITWVDDPQDKDKEIKVEKVYSLIPLTLSNYKTKFTL